MKKKRQLQAFTIHNRTGTKKGNTSRKTSYSRQKEENKYLDLRLCCNPEASSQ